MTNKTIIIAEDSARDREFLANSLQQQYALKIAANGKQALEYFDQQETDYVISDLQMPELNGIEFSRILWKKRPSARIIFWSQHKDEIYLRTLSRIIPADTVYGYILKDNTSEVFRKAVAFVFEDNQCWIDPKVRSLQARAQSKDETITDAEYEALIDIALGLTDNYIARRHYLTRRGVQSRLKTLYQKLNIDRLQSAENETEVMNPRARAVSVAFQRGLLNSKELLEEENKLRAWLQHEGLAR
ncbi:MAG: response regulator transcription factor [Gammaproteobacteria bacterium]